jgi:hypothetical protein
MKLRKQILLALLILLGVGAGLKAVTGEGDKAGKLRALREGSGLVKITTSRDRKIGIMDNGRMVMYYDNNGFIGDRNFQRSIEWPAGTLNYMVWQVGVMFGAVNSDGDTLCSESYNDISDNQFNPEPGYDNPSFRYDPLEGPIVARSDIAESYAARWPMVGGIPQWPGFDGGFIDPTLLRNVGRQESYWVMRDDNDPDISPGTPLHIEVECRLIEINTSLTRDLIFAFYKVRNTLPESQDLRNCRFGILVDPDMPALVGAEFDDDDDGFIRDLNFAYARDTDNFYASKPGFNIGYFGTKFLRSPQVNGKELGLTGWTTFEYGDMPNPGEFYLTAGGPDPDLGQFRSRDHAQYGYMQPGLFMQPRFDSDVAYIMSSGEFDLAVGDSVEIGVAFIAGPSLDGLLKNANAAQEVYDKNFIVPTAPTPPAVTAVPGDHTVTLYWDDEPSESSTDAFTGKADFEGYRIYRSEDRGQTYGTATDLEEIYPTGYVPIAEYDKFNTSVAEISGVVTSHNETVPGASNAIIRSAGLADGSQGGDAGADLSGAFSGDSYTIEFHTDSTFRVNNVTQTVRLSYLSQFLDEDEEIINQGKGFAVLDSAFTIQPGVDEFTGLYTSGFYIYLDGIFVQILDNVDDSTSEKDPTVNAGEIFRVDQKKIEPGANVGLRHHWTDPQKLVNGYEYWYTVSAYDRPDLEIGVPINENLPATVADAPNDQTVAVVPQAPVAGFVEAEAPTTAVFEHLPGGISHVEGFPLTVVDPRLVRDATYLIRFTETDDGKLWHLRGVTATGDTAIQENNDFYDSFADNAQMFDGMLLQVNDLPGGINGDLSEQTVLVDNDTLSLDLDPTSYGDYVYSETHTEKDYEIRFTATPVAYPTDSETTALAPFELYEVTGGINEQIGALVYDDTEDTTGGAGVWSIDESFDLINAPYADPANFSYADDDVVYYLTLAVSDTLGEVSPGNVFRIVGNRRLHEADVYRFTTKAQRIEAKASDLDRVRVVPNPFIVTSAFDVSRDRHEIHFTRVPAKCKIKIFTLAGDLVKTIDYDRASAGQDFAKWDLKTEFGSEVAYGVYLYHLDAGGVGTRMGKIAILR